MAVLQLLLAGALLGAPPGGGERRISEFFTALPSAGTTRRSALGSSTLELPREEDAGDSIDLGGSIEPTVTDPALPGGTCGVGGSAVLEDATAAAIQNAMEGDDKKWLAARH